MSTPTPAQRFRYAYGATLPAGMRDWVRRDLTGPGAARRTVLRWAVPVVALLLPMWFVPASFYVHFEMTMPILIAYVYFSIALNKVWRRSRLKAHGLDPDLVDHSPRRDADRLAYEARYRAQD